MIAGIYTVWAVCLITAVVVILIAAALLIAILMVARSIAKHGVQAFAAAEAIAEDTKAIWALSTTNDVAAEILATTEGIETHGGAIVAALHEPQAISGLGGQR